MNPDISPIALFVYNRPDHTKTTLNALLANDLASKSELYIFSDGPKSAKDAFRVNSVREICKNISGFAKISIIEHNKNMGLANSIINGVTTVFNDYDTVIVFEDDILTSSQCLTFLNTALLKYKNEPVIFNISAWSPDEKIMDFPCDYNWDVYFIPRFNCWGWAMWKDRWEKIDWEVNKRNEFFQSPCAIDGFSRGGGADLPPMLNDYLHGKIDSWAIRAEFSRFTRGLLGVNPVHSYTKNIGMDNSGTHCGHDPKYETCVNERKDMASYPEFIFVNHKIHKNYYNFYSGITEPDPTPLPQEVKKEDQRIHMSFAEKLISYFKK